MTNTFSGKCMVVAAAMAMMLPTLAAAQNSPYRVATQAGTVHIYPTPELSQQIKSQLGSLTSGALTYQGGPVMTGLSLYAIFWVPPTLQDSSPTTLSAKYQAVTKQFLADYPTHGIANNSTQYYSGTTTKKYFLPSGGLAGSFVDTNHYPVGGCTNSVTGKNCINDAQLRTEIQRVMTLNGWTPGMNKMFLVFTSTGEGSCTGSSSTNCAYTHYCAYHGAFGSTTSPTIYANQPYANPAYCKGSQTTPSGDSASDANVNVASHEITEASTDPEGNAWYDSANGEEIGDLCAWQFGPLTWDSGQANQMWNGHYYDLQLEYDNHTASCTNVGP